MSEKVSLPDTHDAPPTATEGPELNNDVAKPRVNGGLQAWLTVLALFCVFVNSWYVESPFYRWIWS